jgi:hypothetical protein
VRVCAECAKLGWSFSTFPPLLLLTFLRTSRVGREVPFLPQVQGRRPNGTFLLSVRSLPALSSPFSPSQLTTASHLPSLSPRRDCQVAAWPRHKKTCGVKTSDIPPVPSQVKRTPNYLQIRTLERLEEYPQWIWYTAAQYEESRGVYGEMVEDFFHLPSFVRPFLPVLSLLTDLRNKAIKAKDEYALGAIALFLQKVERYSPSEYSAKAHIGGMAKLCEIEAGQLERCRQVVEENLSETNPLLASAFKQLETGQAECVSSLRLLSLSPCPTRFPFEPSSCLKSPH